MEVVAADRRVAEVASRQRGIVTLADLHAAGLTRNEIRRRVERGWLHRVHRGVYKVGHLADIPFAAETAALLACGSFAVATHRSSSAVLKLLPPPELPEITLIGGRDARHPGIVIHRSTTLTRKDVWVREGLRITNPRRTLADLAAVASPEELAAAVNEAHALRLIPPGPLEIAAGRRGSDRLRRASNSHATGFTRSKAERLLTALLRRAGLPKPETNAFVAGQNVDAVWREQRVVVEFDGAATHAHRLARDRAKEAALRTAGFDVLRIGWDQLTKRPELVAAQIAAALAPRRGG
ncbi:MAG TPA: type IV toxin-antitoxin system AbiEi family antitoxin domain-containing protein [Solirubrobacteraceae bacterium]|nr:type IV toxin-antitoxin system AbiEi family antitoxin domain-containing protein [Solirubrobacteraceae bacterium]